MSWNAAFESVLIGDVMKLAEEAKKGVTGTYPDSERQQLHMAATRALAVAGDMGINPQNEKTARLTIALSGHAAGPQPGPGDSMVVSVKRL